MHITDFPFCCTAVVAAGFAESATAERDGAMWNSKPATSVPIIKEWLGEEITRAHWMHKALFTVITNSEQKKVNKALRHLGFEHTTWLSKAQHPDTKIRMWWIDCGEYVKCCKQESAA